MGILSDLGSSVTGNIESAYVTIHDYRKVSTQMGAASERLSKATDALGKAGEFKDQIAATAEKLYATKDVKSAAAALSDPANDMKKRFRVQFNPSELQIYSSSLQIPKVDAQRKSGSQVKETVNMSSVPPTIEMTVNLVFDHMNIYDSFMFDKAQLSATGVTNAATAIATVAGKVWTVQTEVEGFIAALRNQYTQKVTFNWEDFVFEGSLSYVSAQYTMFSVSGRPVRAKVMMRLRQLMDSAKLQSWYHDFEEAFSGDSSNLVRPEQYVGNLVNLNL